MSRPQGMADYCNKRSARSIFVRLKATAKEWVDAQQFKKSGADRDPVDALGLPISCQIVGDPGSVRLELIERLALRPPDRIIRAWNTV